MDSSNVLPTKRNLDSKSDPESKVLECMVCGKKFSRGIVDLTRHQQAITLKHLFSTSRTSTCTLPCDDCGLFFSTQDHLNLHQVQSSCPIKKKRSHESPPKKKSKSQLESNPKVMIGKQPQPPLDEDNSIESKNSTVQPNLASTHLSIPASHSADSRRAKKGKVLIPEERKAFFAILSVLLKPSLGLTGDVPKLDTENIFQFIPEEHASLVQKLKSTLLYDCE